MAQGTGTGTACAGPIDFDLDSAADAVLSADPSGGAGIKRSITQSFDSFHELRPLAYSNPDERSNVAKSLDSKEPCVQVGKELFGRLPTWAQHTVNHNLKCLRNGQPLNVGSLFTGSNLQSVGYEVFLSSIGDCGDNASLVIEHTFACEIDAKKREFLVELDLPRYIFADVAELKNDEAMDLLSHAMVRIPKVEVATVGFVCKTLSGLNNTDGAKTGRKACIETGEEKTGKAFADSIAWMARHRPKVVLLENVTKTLKMTADGLPNSANMKAIVDKMKSAGFLVFPVDMNCKDLGIPQNRPRMWFIALDVETVRTFNFEMEAAVPDPWRELQRRVAELRGRLNGDCEDGMVPLSEFLLLYSEIAECCTEEWGFRK